jgi:mannosyltransferase
VTASAGEQTTDVAAPDPSGAATSTTLTVDASQTDAGRTDSASTRRPWWRRADRVLLAAVVVGAVLRFWGLGAQSMWYDEWLSAEAATGSLTHLRQYVTGQAGIPPLYFAFLWVWARVVGDGDAALRAVSALAGVATIPVTYAAVRALGQRRTVARSAALLVAVHPMLVWYSQEARPYSLLALLGALSVLCLTRVCTRGTPRDLGLWALVCALALAVHYFAVFLVAAEVAVVLVRRPWQGRSRRELLVAGAAAGAVLLLLAPFAAVQFSRRANHSWITDYGLRMRLKEFGTTTLVGPTPTHGRMWELVCVLVLVAVALLAVRGTRDEWRAVAATAGLGVATVALAVAANVVGVDMVLSRYLIVTLALFIIAVAVGLHASRVPRWIGHGVVAALCVISVVTVAYDATDPKLQRANWRAVADAHDATAGVDGARVIVMNLHGYLGQPMLRYLDDENARRVGDDESILVEEINVPVARPTDRPCGGFIGMECSMIFLGAAPPEPLADEFRLVERIELEQFWLDRYVADEPMRVTIDDLVPEIDRPRSRAFITNESERDRG